MQLTPIPPYLVYDCFESDVDAGIIYEHLCLGDHQDTMLTTQDQSFLHSCLVGQWRNADAKPFVPLGIFHTIIPSVIRQCWGKAKFASLFPDLVPGTVCPPAAIPRRAEPQHQPPDTRCQVTPPHAGEARQEPYVCMDLDTSFNALLEQRRKARARQQLTHNQLVMGKVSARFRMKKKTNHETPVLPPS